FLQIRQAEGLRAGVYAQLLHLATIPGAGGLGVLEQLVEFVVLQCLEPLGRPKGLLLQALPFGQAIAAFLFLPQKVRELANKFVELGDHARYRASCCTTSARSENSRWMRSLPFSP